MTGYIARRIVRAIVLLIGVVVLAYVLFTALPGADPSRPSTGFLDYLKAIFLHFNFGYSSRNQESVLSLIGGRLPATLSLIVGAGLLSVALAIPIGVMAAIRRGTRFDRVAMGAALGVVSTPVFWLGLILLYLLASDVGKIPILPGPNSYVGLTASPGKWFTSLILPWLVLGAAEAATYSRMLRGQMQEVMDERYILGARAKGLSDQRVVWRHGAGAALPAAVNGLALGIGALIGGAVLVETVFRINGVGLLDHDAILHSDFPTVQGTVVLVAMFMVLVSLLVDIGYAWLDPRRSLA